MFTTQRTEDSISNSVKKLLSNLFKRRKSEIANLHNVFLSIGRGYSDCKSLISWVVKSSGTIFETMKRTLWAPFTYDQNKFFSSDERSFEQSKSYRCFQRKILNIMEQGRPILFLNAIFL